MVKSLEPVGVDRYLRDDHILDEPFSVALLIDLGFSADALDPLFDSGIFREPLPNRAEGSSLRARAAAKLPRTQEFEGAIWLARTGVQRRYHWHVYVAQKRIAHGISDSRQRVSRNAEILLENVNEPFGLPLDPKSRLRPGSEDAPR